MKRKFQIGFVGAVFFTLGFSLPSESENKAGIQLPFSVLESRIDLCKSKPTFHRGCKAALSFLENKLPISERAKLHRDRGFRERFVELHQILHSQSGDTDWVTGALNAWLAALDPHAKIVASDVEESQAKNSHFDVKGIGVRVRVYQDRVLVAYAVEGSAAEQSGVLAGDELVEVNSVNLRALDKGDKESALKRARSPYSLKVLRGGRKIELQANERKFQLENISAQLRTDAEGKTGVLRIRSFAKDSACGEIYQAVKSLESRGAVRLEIDLRDNGGGYVREAQCAAGLFLGAGKMFAHLQKINGADDLVPVMPLSRSKNRDVTLFTDQDQATELPVLIHINQNTASAAEMFAAALQDEKRAKVIGARSFGKGSMQSAFHPWNDPDLLLFKTTHIISRPSGKVLQYAGVTPDVLTEKAEGSLFPREIDLTR